jgi:spore coat polysaccharide biosynthesis protein SpsF
VRKLVAALACRVNGARLYGKPLQLLDVERRVSVLGHLVELLRTEPSLSEIVLGVAEGKANEVFHDVARELGLRAVTGSEEDVLRRLILCGEATLATDIFRVTTESPFTYVEPLAEAWERHVSAKNDVTVVDGLPEGAHFEIFTLDALRRSHDRGERRHRSELCSLYVREHRDEFRVEVLPVPAAVARPDLRLTIDYPEDLVLCRRVYARLRARAPRIPLEQIIAVLDADVETRALVASYVVPTQLY